MTSAPMAARNRVAPAPASWPEKSQIRTPPNALRTRLGLDVNVPALTPEHPLGVPASEPGHGVGADAAGGELPADPVEGEEWIVGRVQHLGSTPLGVGVGHELRWVSTRGIGR